MVKKSNKGIMITLSKKDIEILDFIARTLDCSKTDVIKKCLKSSKNIKTLWNEIEYQELSNEDKKYYVKCVESLYYLNDNRLTTAQRVPTSENLKELNDLASVDWLKH